MQQLLGFSAATAIVGRFRGFGRRATSRPTEAHTSDVRRRVGRVSRISFRTPPLPAFWQHPKRHRSREHSQLITCWPADRIRR